jgi:hypothetical protein
MVDLELVYREFIVVPIIYVVATPFILISALFRQSGVRGGYAAVTRWLDEMRTYH